MYYEWARRPLMEYWRESDEAYLCYRQLPKSEGMQWTDKSDFGETDIFDGVNMLATRLSLAMMDKSDSWLTVVSRQDDDAAVVDSIQAQQIWMHDRAHTRRMIARHLKQLMVRGTSAIYVTWEHRERRRKISNAQGRKRLKALMKAGKAPADAIDKVDSYYLPEIDYMGPKIRVLDALDLYLDPAHDLTVDRKSAYVIGTYRRLSELKLETDREGKKLYSNLENITSWTPTEIYMKDIEGSNRIQNLNTMGVYPQNQPYRNEGYVPVYIVYQPYFEHEGEEFFDTYFHVAQSREANANQIIRVEQNPSRDGHQFLIKDTMVDWFGNTAYGISLVEKLLSKYNQKNVLSAITLEAALTSVFPAYNILSGTLRDDTGVSFAPGALNEFMQNPLNEKFITPMPAPLNGVQIGMQELRWWGEAIASGFGEWGGMQNNPTRSISSRETATAANIKATSGSLAIDELVEKFSVSLQELGQLCYDLSRQELEPQDGKISFPQGQGAGKAQMTEIDWDKFDMPRDILVAGTNGAFDKAQEIQNMTQALQGIGQMAGMLPNAAQLAQPILLKLLNKLNVTVPDSAKMSEEQLAATNPGVVQAVIQKLSQENPQIAQVVQQMMQAQGQKPQAA